MKIGIIASTAILLATATVPNALAFTVTQNNTSKDGISVNIKQIKELAQSNLLNSDASPSQALAQTVASVVSHDPSGPNGNFTEVLDANDVLKYFYPKYTVEQLKGATITPNQAVEWLHTKGYTATIIDRALTTAEIKARLDKSEPIITVFDNTNADSWLWKNYAGVLYAHDDVETGTAEGKLHASFIKTVNFGEAIVNDGQEAQTIKFSELQHSPDPTQSSAQYKWVSTITGIKRDSSWENAQSIKGDKAKGVFASKLTKAGTQSQLDFTDPEVTKLLNKYPASSKEHKTKLAAVSLINLYEDAQHQKTVKDLEDFLKITPTTFVTSQQIINWYQYLGFDFDVYKGRAPMALTKAINDKGRLYLTLFKAKDAKNKEQNTAALGTGYLNDTFNGYRPYWSTVKAEDSLVPFYDVPLTAAGLKKQQELARKFQYTNVQRLKGTWPVEKTTYDEEMTLYNIRLKGTSNDSGITTPPTSSVTTPPTNSNIQPTTTANYKQAKDFKIREKQGQQPWCSEYVNAAAVNTVSHAGEKAITSAKEIMQLDRPGLNDEELSKLPGTTIEHILKVIKDKYQVTADFEERTLSFAEVKKEIDAGGIIQIDGNNNDSKDAPGTGDNLGHAVSIVGYVTPTSGKQVPYYIIWNPWWETTFYLSTNAKTYNLGGTNYKWARTWHNWKKTSPSTSVKTLDPKIANKKVTQTPNPMSLKDNTKLSLDLANPGVWKANLRDFRNKQDGFKQSVANLGAVISVKNPFSPDIYGFATGKLNNKNGLSVIKNNIVKNVYLDGNSAAQDYKSAIWSMYVDRNDIASYALSLGVIMAVTIIVGAVPVLNAALPAVTSMLMGSLGAVDVYQFLQTCYDFKDDYNDTVASYNKLI